MRILAQGGPVSSALVLVCFAMWTIVALRWFVLAEARGGTPRQKTANLARYRSALRVLVAIAPLLGLLGTVGGMVEMFSSLDGRGFEDEASVAGGISTALVTTQLGLVIGAPGLVASRLLDRRERRLVARARRTS